MKKLIALLLCFITVFALCACGKSEPAADDNADAQDEGFAGMSNPMTECASLEEVNAAVGGNLCGPAAMGVSDEAYFVIDCGSYKIGEFRFKVNGYDYTMRCAKTKEDISGVYLSGQNDTAFAEENSSAVTEDNGMQTNSDGEYKCARWFVGDMQYALTVNDGDEIESETFISIADEFVNKTQGNM